MSTPTATVLARAGQGTTSGRDQAEPAYWSAVQDLLRTGTGTSWLSVRSRSGVHTRPVFAAWGGTSFVFASKGTAAKTGHLWRQPDVSLAVDLGTLHLVVEGDVAHLTARAELERASAALLEVFDWPTTVTGRELDAPYAAPTSGGPPFPGVGAASPAGLRLPGRGPGRAHPLRLPGRHFLAPRAGSTGRGEGTTDVSRGG